MDTKPCPCCEGRGAHGKQVAVDHFRQVDCASCDGKGEVPVCVECHGDGYIDKGDKFTEGLHCGGFVADVRHCFECSGTGLDDYLACDMAKTLENTRVRPAAEDF